MSLAKLQRLKALFDESSVELINDYWTQELLESYTETLGERIHWKWDAFLKDIQTRNLHPENLFPKHSFEITDWGCGPGTASLALAKSFTQKELIPYSAFQFVDRSPLAVAYAQKRISDYLDLSPQSSFDPSRKKLKILLISYVLSELNSQHEKQLLEEIQKADIFFWVDSGAFIQSKRLSQLRNQLLMSFSFLSPCPHQLTCPLTQDQNSKDWCHRFAKAPQEVFHSAKWAELSKVLKIDLRSLPYSSLFAVKNNLLKVPSQNSVFLSRPRVGKHEILWDKCTPEGTYETHRISKRAEPELFKKIRKL